MYAGHLLDVRRHLSGQRGRQHLPGAVPNQHIQQRPRRRRRRLSRSFLSNYREHGRTFPTGVATPALLEEPDRTTGKVGEVFVGEVRGERAQRLSPGVVVGDAAGGSQRLGELFVGEGVDGPTGAIPTAACRELRTLLV